MWQGFEVIDKGLAGVPMLKAVIYERQKWNMQFPQKYIAMSQVFDCKTAKANLIFVDVAGYKLQHSRHERHPLEK